ncbi:MAG: radical SAM/SPASM domain-containing protein [Candidatus Kerfeldbacteria bacterium]
MRLPYLLNPVYRAARRLSPEAVKPALRGYYNSLNKLATYGRSDIFTALDIETNSRCNLKCTYCAVARYDRGDHFMTEEMFRKIIDDLVAFPFEYKGRISPHFYGDPLIDKRLPSLMAYVREKLPKSSIIIHTNAVALTKELFHDLIDAGTDGLVITKHMAYWPKVVQELVEDDKSKKYITLQLLDNVGIFERGGTVPVNKAHKFKCCYYVSDEIAVDYAGNVVCTNDFFVRHPFGNVAEQSLAEIWWDPEFVQTRHDLRRGKMNLKMCREICGDDPIDWTEIPNDTCNKDITHW